MEAKQFTLDELEKMLSDHIAFHLGKLDVASAQCQGLTPEHRQYRKATTLYP